MSLMGIYLALSRAGEVEQVIDRLEIAELQLKEREEKEIHLRKIIEKTQNERDYWYKLWLRMGIEFESAQSALIEEIDVLRRKLGMNTAKRRELERLAVQKRRELFVGPTTHPSTAISSPQGQIDCPPRRYSDGEK